MLFSDFVDINPKIELKKGGSYPFIEMADLTPGKRYISASTQKEFKGGGSRFQTRDIIFARITPCLEHGKIAQIKGKDNGKYFGSTEFFVFRAKGGISDEGFLFYLSYSDILRKPAEKSMYGASGRQRASLDVVKTIKIPEISFNNQKKISSILSTYDNLIENNTRRIQILEEMAQRIYQEWFVNFQFQGHEKDKIVNSELGKIPEGWSVERLDKYVDFERGVEPGSDNYEKYTNKENVPFLRVGDLGNRSIEIFVNQALTKNKIIREGDIAVSMDGTPGIVKMGLFGCYSTGIRKLVIKDKVMKKPFLYFLMISEHIQNIIKAHSKGTTILHASESIKHMNFILPANDLMITFDEIVSPMIKEILLFNKQNKILRETRDLLLPKLISGELNIPELDISIREQEA